MIPDAECLKIVAEILSELKLGGFVIKVSIYKVQSSLKVNHDYQSLTRNSKIIIVDHRQ